MKLKYFGLVFLGLFLVSLVSAYSYYGGYNSWSYYLSPSNLLQNEWVVFMGIGLITFSVVYMALLGSLRKHDERKGAIVVISLVISVFTASALTQRAMWYGYLGDVIFNWVMLGVFLILGFLAVMLGNTLRKNDWSWPFVVGLPVIIIWFLIKFLNQTIGFNLFELFNSYGLYALTDFIGFFLLDGVFWGLVALIVIGYLIGRRKGKKEKIEIPINLKK